MITLIFLPIHLFASIPIYLYLSIFLSINLSTYLSIDLFFILMKQEKEVAWGARWDRFLVNSDPNIHWYSIVNSLIILIFLSAMVAVIMLRTLHNDISLYNEEDNKVCVLGNNSMKPLIKKINKIK